MTTDNIELRNENKAVAAGEVPEITASKTIFLVEFTDMPNIRHILEKDDDSGYKTAEGARLYRIIDAGSNVLATFDIDKGAIDVTPLKGLTEYYFVVAQPGTPDYFWKIMSMVECTLDDMVAVKGLRDATPEESAYFDSLFPGWLEACSKLTKADDEANPERAKEIKKLQDFKHRLDAVDMSDIAKDDPSV